MATAKQAGRSRLTYRPGIGVDAGGGAVVDPTENVKALALASADRQDDLRDLNDRRIDAEIRVLAVKVECMEEMANLRADFAEKLSRAESGRLDSIRQVDREEVAKTAMQANTAIDRLATAATTTAETLRNQVATTAQAQADSFSNSMGEVNKRLSQLELTSSEGKGKQTATDPVMVELVAEVKALRTSGANKTGESAGAKSLWTYIAVGVGLLVTLFMAAITVGGVIVAIAYAIKR